ncbi:MAG: bifunctional aspartate kinase/homoserine dehydrogenase I [Treponema sp.]|jgi:aspartokinase/homoserine dehydrogenase 1|nr:bifunctional aspartate kinase/homoserine dehydrogenase I [Treponema sp.]
MFVLKFGGTSVGTPDAITRVIDIVKGKGNTPVIVISALSGVTDHILKSARLAAAGDKSYKESLELLFTRHQTIARHFLNGQNLESTVAIITALCTELHRICDGIAILRELSPRTLDMAASFGEQLSAQVITAILNSAGCAAAYLDTRTLIVTDKTYGHAQVLFEQTYENIKHFFADMPPKAPVQVATGFIARSSDSTVTTLGRGGSDFTAALFGAVLEAEEVEIWTDVDGILTAEPQAVKNAFTIDAISYIEAMELSHFGAKVIYPPTIKPALKKGIPIRIRNTFNPSHPGTIIAKEVPESTYPIRGISSIRDIALVRFQGSGMVGVVGSSARLFSALARKNINIILITQSSSEYSICIAILPKDIDRAETAITEEFNYEIQSGVIDPPVVERNLSIIAVVGTRMKQHAGVSGKVFHALGRNGISVIAIAQGSSEINISAVVAERDETKALNAIHEAFFWSTVRSVNLFLVGAGLIGGTLLEQIATQQETLEKDYHIRINIIGAGDRYGMLFDRHGLDPRTIKETVRNPQSSLEPFDITVFIDRMKSFNVPNSTFCDCTASDEIAAHYAEILRSAIAIVTPNKRANSSSYAYYQTLTRYSRDRGIPYLYETTVCAGLPVLSTLRDLFLSGDRIQKIETVASGTLSFIFNNFDGSKPFSALVREAQAKGYTEPDPRDDLNAMDTARKALILARECGIALEFSAVTIEPILPPACIEAPNVEAFFRALAQYDGVFEEKRAAAAAAQKKLCYVATVEHGHVTLSLRAEGAESPFASLVDADNIIVITTDRYATLPMVIKGPGAGAHVTAGGVFADIVRLARTLV